MTHFIASHLPSALDRVQRAIHDFKQGKLIILTDDPGRENEGDMILPAEKITPALMNFLIRHGSGIVCLALTAEHLHQLRLPLMVPPYDNSSLGGTAFTVSIDAKSGITTGVSAADRTHTILTAVKANVTADDFVKPGHLFPLQAKDNGVLARQGHTEGSVDLAKLAGFQPAAVLCEVMNPDGSMTQGKQLLEFSHQHQLTLLSIDDIVTYRQHYHL